MTFKRNLIVILVLVNLLLLFFVLSKHEKFNAGRAALIDPTLKNKVKIESNALLDTTKTRNKKQNSELFIDGDVSLGININGDLPNICFGSKCYTSNNLKDFLKYSIPYEVFETDPIEQKIPDRLCYDGDGQPNCITGEDLKLLNGDQYIYIAGPRFDQNQSSSFRNQYHLQSNIGPAPHYYYDINNNYFEKEGKKNKEDLPEFDHPSCKGGKGEGKYSNSDLKKSIKQSDDYKNTGLDRVPLFFNLSVLDDVSNDIKNSIKIDKTMNGADYKCSGDYGSRMTGDRCGDGILQMVKQPVHKKRGSNYDSDNAYQHEGEKGKCKGEETTSQNNQIMNLAAVNLLPHEFKGPIGGVGNVNVRDRIKYKLVPGEKTGLKCAS